MRMHNPRRTWSVVALVLALFLVGFLAAGAQEVDPGPGVSAAVEDDRDAGDVESADDIPADLGEDLSRNSPSEAWQYVSIVLIPLVVQWLKRQEWTTEAKTALMVGLSFVVALAGSYFRGELDNFTFTGLAVLQIVIGTQVAYQVLSQLPGTGKVMNGLADAPTPLPPRQSP